MPLRSPRVQIIAAAWLATAGFASDARAQTTSVTLGPGAASDSSITDTTVAALDNNNGVDEFLYVGRDGSGAPSTRRSLMRFDLASAALPPGAIVTRAVLRLEIVAAPHFGAAPSNFGLHRVAQAWTEGTVNGPDPVSGQAGVGGPCPGSGVTWNDANCPNASWNSACAPAETCGVGGHFVTSPSAQVAAGTGASVIAWDSSLPGNAAMLTDVVSWIAAPSGNQGWLIKSDAENLAKTARRLASSEGVGTVSLQLEYRVPAPVPATPGWALLVCVAGFGVASSFVIRRHGGGACAAT